MSSILYLIKNIYFQKKILWKICVPFYYLYVSLRRIQNILLSLGFSFIVASKNLVRLKIPCYAIGIKYVTIGENFKAGPGFRIECFDYYLGEKYTPSVKIGNNVCINYNCHIGAVNSITIGDNVLIGSNVLITDHSHGSTVYQDLCLAPASRHLYSKGEIIIEDNVWIGEGVCILPGVVIGHNSVIGANAVVTHDIPAFRVAIGNPWRTLKRGGECL